MSSNGRDGRIRKLEQQWGMGGTCPTCRDGTLTRVVMVHDDHVDELHPEFCPDCGVRREHTFTIDLTHDDDQEWPA